MTTSTVHQQAVAARIAAQNAHTAQHIASHHVEMLDYEELIQHLISLPAKEQSGLEWCILILRHYEFGALLNEPEASYAEKVMRMLLGLGIFTLDTSRSAKRKVRKVYGPDLTPAPVIGGYSDQGWYRFVS